MNTIEFNKYNMIIDESAPYMIAFILRYFYYKNM